ncbi:hypothetical protein LINPERHAP1_LOCUS23519 [Linum perenne]
MTTVAGLPQYVVLKYTATGKYLHYLYNDEDSGVYYTCIGVKRDVDRFNPFVKFEVVPSTINPTHVHLRLSFTGKFIELAVKDGISWLSATADFPDEDLTKETSTIFQPIVENGTVGFLHVQRDKHVRIFFNEEYSNEINNVACAYMNDGAAMVRFEFSQWVPSE